MMMSGTFRIMVSLIYQPDDIVALLKTGKGELKSSRFQGLLYTTLDSLLLVDSLSLIDKTHPHWCTNHQYYILQSEKI